MIRSRLYFRLKLWLRVCRVWDWGQSKIPFYLAATLLLAPAVGVVEVVAILAMLAALASFGYGLNEIADRVSDARAGQRNLAAELAPLDRYAFPLLAGVLALALSLAGGSGFGAATLFALVCLAASTAYSVAPVRLKERGFSGLFAAAAAQWSLPVFAVGAAATPGGWRQPETVILAALGLALGLRWMAIHQAQDHWADRVAGVRTFGAMGGPLFRIIVVALAAEMVLLGWLLFVAWPVSEAAAIALPISIVVDAVLHHRGGSRRSRLQSYAAAPLASFYFLVFPAAMVLSVVVPSMGAVATALIAVVGGHGLLWLRRRNGSRRTDGLSAGSESPSGTPLERGTAFLADRQSSDGGFHVRLGPNRDLSDSKSFPCVFETAYLTNILAGLDAGGAADEIVRRARAFLRDERELSGGWRYFLRGSLIPEEVDTIACALTALEPERADDAVIERILANRGADGALRTWMVEAAHEADVRNMIDVGVNVNVYTLLRRRGLDDDLIKGCLEQSLIAKTFKEGSPYYHSPFFFLYAMAKVAGEFDPSMRERLRREVVDGVTSARRMDLLETAQACAALTLLGADPKLRDSLLDRLLPEQLSDGGWPGVAMCWGLNPERFWCGSREMTTVFCMESIALAARSEVLLASAGALEREA